MPQAYWIIPLEGGQIDNSLPGGRPPHIGGGPIYHPGHPDHGLPSQPGHPGNRPPGSWGGPVDPGWGGGGGHPSHPIHIPGVPDQGLPPGEEIPSNELPPPAVPPEHADDLIIGVRQPNSEEWTFTAYDVAPDQGQPQPTPHRRR